MPENPDVPCPCEDCGLCCMQMNVPPRDMDAEFPPDLAAEVNGYLDSCRYADEDWPCLWLDRATGLCRNYEHRPDTCREYEVGGEPCLQLRREHGLPPPWPRPGRRR